MEHSVYLLGNFRRVLRERFMAETLSAGDSFATITRLSIEVEPAQQVRGLAAEQQFLGALISPRNGEACLELCQQLSPAAQLSGAVDTLLRLEDGRLYGDYLRAAAIAALLREEGVGHVRTALVLGSGRRARSAFAALRELHCARYEMGHLKRDDPARLGMALRGLKKQIQFFSLEEMLQFFDWAEHAGAFESTFVPPTESGGAERKLDKGAKRWDLLVNATSLGARIFSDDTKVAGHNFLSCVNRVLDLTSHGEPTTLVHQARAMGVPALTADNLDRLHSAEMRKLCVRLLRGEQLAVVEPQHTPPPFREPRRYNLRRRGRR